MDILVKPLALTGYMLLSIRELAGFYLLADFTASLSGVQSGCQ